MWWSLTLTLVVVLIASLYLYCRKRYQYFAERGVRSLTPLPLDGSFWRSAFLRKHLLEDLRDGYNAFPNDKYVGAFEAFSPVIIIRDPDLIKKITVKDFDHFHDHRNPIFNDMEHILASSLLMLKGQKWRDMRGTLSPAFTGSKMRLMLPFMEDISKQFVQHLHNETKDGENGKMTESKDLYEIFTRYSNDIIASCAFGSKVNSVEDQQNKFYRMGRDMTNFSKFKFFMLVAFPRFSKLIGLKFFSPEATTFFQNLVSSTMRYREENIIIKKKVLIKAKKLYNVSHVINSRNKTKAAWTIVKRTTGTLKYSGVAKAADSLGFATAEEADIHEDNSNHKKWTDDELTAQAFLFFIAGFETGATVLTFALHELAINTDVQEKLYAEVQHSRTQHDRLSYETIQKLRYMDMVISECLRKWTAGIILDRECQKEYTLEPSYPGGKPYVLKPKDVIYILACAMHMDPQYFPEPHKFDPERFSDERKHEIKPFTYLPFGSGPRNCIGSRFALMELKVILYYLLLDFEVVACEKTINPIRLEMGFKIKAVGGSSVQFKSRK